jgi:nucleoside-diphosphate-sugar epimerase
VALAEQCHCNKNRFDAMSDSIRRREVDSTYADKRVLVTGGMGFLGGHLAKRLVEAGAEVTIFDVDVSPLRSSIVNDLIDGFASRVALVCGDVRSDSDIEKALETPFDFIFHFAAYSVIEHSTEHPVDTIQTNVLGVVKLLEAIRQSKWRPSAIVFASTDKVYGQMETPSYSEDSPLRGIGVYDAAKLAGDVFARTYNEVFGLPSVVLRLCNVFGPHDHNTSFRLIPKALTKIFAKCEPEPPTLYYDSLNHWRDYLYVNDAVDAFLLVGSLSECHGQVYNVSAAIHAPTPQILRDVVAAAVDAERATDLARAEQIDRNGIQVEMRTGNSAVVAIDRQHLDGSKLCALGFAPRTEFQDGLVKTVHFYRQHYRSLD